MICCTRLWKILSGILFSSIIKSSVVVDTSTVAGGGEAMDESVLELDADTVLFLSNWSCRDIQRRMLFLSFSEMRLLCPNCLWTNVLTLALMSGSGS